MNKSEKLTAKIEALRHELVEAKASEKEAAVARARQEIDRAIRTAGLLDLVTSGALSPSVLASAFHTLADRARRSTPTEILPG